MRNLPEYEWQHPLTGYAYQGNTDQPLDIGYTTGVEVTAPEWSESNWALWIMLGIIGALLLMPGRKERKNIA